MKILYHHRIRSQDGQYVHVSEIIHALESQGHEVVVVGPTVIGNSTEKISAGWVAYLKRYLPRAIYEILEFSYSLYDFVLLWQSIRRRRPDFIYERYNLFLTSGIWSSKLFSIPLLLEVNAPLVQERSQYGGIGLERIARWAESYVWRKADVVLPVTAVLGEIIESCGVPHSRIHVIANGVNEADFSEQSRKELKARQAWNRDVITVGFVGYLRDWHRLDRVILLLAKAGNEGLRFLVVGDGPARSDLEKLAEDKGVTDRMTIVGEVERCMLPDYISQFDIALQPSVVDYASPLKLQEYLALGCATVAPNKENIREVLTHGENGILFEPSDDSAFEDAVVKLCDNTELRERIGRNAIHTIQRLQLTWNDNARRIIALARDVI